MGTVLSGEEMPITEMLSRCDDAVTRFPFDPSLRAARRYVRQQIAIAEKR
jgi:hypothetical protein